MNMLKINLLEVPQDPVKRQIKNMNTSVTCNFWYVKPKTFKNTSPSPQQNCT